MNPYRSEHSRWSFIKAAAAGSLAVTVGVRGLAAESREGILYRKLGRTGEMVSAIGLGGSHIGRQHEEEESIRIVRTALDRGINFLDNCWDYNGGASEIRMGKALRDGYREKAFLMTKIDGRNKATAAKQIDESLQRLQTDHVDLMQFHEIIRMEDPERIFAEGGAMEAMLAAQKAGKVRHIGFTGHKSPDIHLHMLEVADAHHFTFETAQMPMNVMDAHFNSFEKKVLPELVKRGMGVLGMKPIGGGELLKSRTVSAKECLQYAMSLPVSVTINGCDSLALLKQALDVAQNFKPLGESEMAAVLAKSAPASGGGTFELYKTSHNFDATIQHPEWLG
jgi:predicted aldo/keto reductase-like oxidoreductase